MAQLSDAAKKKRKDYNDKYEKIMSQFSHEAQMVITASRCNEEMRKKSTDEVIKIYISSGCTKPSDFLRNVCPEIYQKWIRDDFSKDLFWCIDNVTKWSVYDPYSDISGRDSDYTRHMYTILKILKEFHTFSIFEYPVKDIVTHNNMSDVDAQLCINDELYEFFTYGAVSCLCHGDKDTEKFISDILTGSAGYYVSVEKCAHVVFMSDNKSLVEKTADLIVSSGIEEGSRLYAGFGADTGTEENFLFMLKFCIENHMLRFPSIQTSADSWTDISTIINSMKEPQSFPAYTEAQKISGELQALVNEGFLKVIYESSTDPQILQKYLTAEDPVTVYAALISIKIHSYSKAYNKAFELLNNGTDNQQIAVYYFLLSADTAVQSAAGKYVFENNSDNFMLLAYYNDFYMNSESAHDAVYKVCTNKIDEQYRIRELSDVPRVHLTTAFESTEEACRHYDMLMKIYTKMDKKNYGFKPVGFPWYDLSIGRSEILQKLCIIANMTDDNEKIEQCAAKLSEISAQTNVNYKVNRDVYLYLLLSRPKNQNQKKLLFSYIADKDRRTREAAFELVKQYDKPDNDVLPVIEDMLRLKSADIRNNALTLISQYPDSQQESVIARLLADKKSEKRACGLDILLRLSKDEKRAELFNSCKKYISFIEKPSEAEKLVIDEINLKECSPSDISGHGIYDPANVFFPEFEFDENDRKRFCEIFTNSVLADKLQRVEDDRKGIELLRELDNIFEENKNYEYTSYDGTACLLGNHMVRTGISQDVLDALPLSDVWKEFYSQKICSYETLVKMCVYLIDDKNKKFRDKAYQLYGNEYSQCISLKYPNHVHGIVQILLNRYYDIDKYSYIARTIIYYILNYLNADDRIIINEFQNITCLESDLYFKLLYEHQILCFDTNEFEIYYRTRVSINKIMDRDHPDYKMTNVGVYSHRGLSLDTNIKAYIEGIINKDTLYYCICKATRFEMESLSREEEIIRMHMEDPSYKLNKREKAVLECCEDIIPEMVDQELRRGESESEFSQALSGIRTVYGVKTFVRILLGMGSDKFQRGHHYHYNSQFISKNESFSHLMSICEPYPGETADDLKRELKGHNISQKRLIEASLYASCRWIKIIEDYLGWGGYASACYYFIAHMDVYNNMKVGAMIAKYTPLQQNELREGAFDIEWFRDAYNSIGQERFKIIYDAAKYITDGGKHVRARKFADAVNGKLDPIHTRKEIEEKRNRDTLLAYALIALKDENEAKERYLYLQQFLKESKKFGSSKRESEAGAVSAATGNLSRNAGYKDVTRFRLRMENLFIKDTLKYFEWHEADDVKVKISVGELGKASVSVMKNEKLLKSIPASMKKNEHILELKELCTKITDQYRRTKIMFERSMEEKSEYSADELSQLHQNPATAPVVDNIVFRLKDHMGFIYEGVLKDCDSNTIILKNNDMLVPVHCYDLWKSGKWHDYQKYVFENKIIQPFKQVFRELYVKTDEELEQTYCARYRGMYFRPKVASGCLNSRDWVYDYENGMQKVYYDTNIIATVNAQPYWFLSVGSEDPSFEKIEFYSRKTGGPLKIKDVPEMVFSEIMRDIDLAVSVAYSGDTDPETSLSTIEIRRSVAEFTMDLFKMKNVTFQKHHAIIKGKLAEYSLHLGSGIVHIIGGPQINIHAVKSYNKSKLFIPFEDDDNKTAEIISKMILLSEDTKIKDPLIMDQIKRK